MEGDLVDEESANPSERAYQRLLPRVDHLPASHQRKWLYYKLFPNVAFDIYPDQVDFMQFLPVSATETVIREISYALPDERREMKAARYLNWRINRRVNAEDTELITRVQLGMQSPAYEAGPLGTSEVCLRSFAQKLRRLIPEARLELAAAAGLEPFSQREMKRTGRPASAIAPAPQQHFEARADEHGDRIEDADRDDDRPLAADASASAPRPRRRCRGPARARSKRRVMKT